jgi:hypothetical protein
MPILVLIVLVIIIRQKARRKQCQESLKYLYASPPLLLLTSLLDFLAY